MEAISPGSGVVALHAELRALVCSLGVQVGLLAEGLSEENVAALIETGGGTKDQGDVRRFLNRILGLSVRGQNLLFGYFTEVFEAEVKAAKAEGKYSEGVSDLSGSNIHIAYTKTVLKDPMGSGAELRHSRVLIDRGVSFDKAKEILDAQRRLPKDGFYRMRREMYGRTQVILALAKPGARNTFSIYRPNTGASFFEMDVEELDTKYRKYEDCDEELARHPWAQTYELTERGCMHGASCAVSRDGTGRECTAGSRQVRCCILSGAALGASYPYLYASHTKVSTAETRHELCAGRHVQSSSIVSTPTFLASSSPVNPASTQSASMSILRKSMRRPESGGIRHKVSRRSDSTR